MSAFPFSDGLAPPWASAWGIDRSGRYAEFEYEGVSKDRVVQRLRWIPAGSFWMGSPKDEAERASNETRHRVTLTEGFWLADTACTQALWAAVVGAAEHEARPRGASGAARHQGAELAVSASQQESLALNRDPSHFKGPRRPVERVSWEDCEQFLRVINEQVTGLDLRLPTEAEWEYACRAGTGTPFFFGEQITPEQVNYHGERPYAGGAKGQYRRETVEVGSLPRNGWGLYEMHGNVYEWCEDWYGEYPREGVTNPRGASGGEDRVVRGGSWGGLGGLVRSAYRFRFVPGFRYVALGFRFARGP